MAKYRQVFGTLEAAASTHDRMMAYRDTAANIARINAIARRRDIPVAEAMRMLMDVGLREVERTDQARAVDQGRKS